MALIRIEDFEMSAVAFESYAIIFFQKIHIYSPIIANLCWIYSRTVVPNSSLHETFLRITKINKR